MTLQRAERVALDETIRKAEQLSRVEFSVFVGHAEGDPRAFARACTARWSRPARSILIMVDPAARAARGRHRRRRPPHPPRPGGRAAVAAMQSLFAAGDLVGGLRRGIQMLAEHARAPETLHAEPS